MWPRCKSSSGKTNRNVQYERKTSLKQAQLGVPHLEIQVELACQILNFAQNPREGRILQRHRTTLGGRETTQKNVYWDNTHTLGRQLGWRHCTTLKDMFILGWKHRTALKDMFILRWGHRTTLKDMFRLGWGHRTTLKDFSTTQVPQTPCTGAGVSSLPGPCEVERRLHHNNKYKDVNHIFKASETYKITELGW